jgi:hypothetical protein
MTEKPHPAAIVFSDAWYLRDAKGSLVPIAAVKATDLLIDETVRGLLEEARDLSARIAAFKQRAFDRVGELQALLLQEYGAKLGGTKGNITLLTFNGRERVQVQVADQLEFGPELQAAKALIDECLMQWSSGSAVELQMIVNRAFSVDKGGQINRTELFMLLRADIKDPRWLRAMTAIRDSMRIVGSRTYMRFYDRSAADAPWHGVPIDIAAA